MQKNNIRSLESLWLECPERARTFNVRQPRLLLDYARIPFDPAGRDRLTALADGRNLRRGIEALFGGEHINLSEDRPALHMALRAPEPEVLLPAEQARRVNATRGAFLDLADRLHLGRPLNRDTAPVTDLLHIGIGGSDLGPRLVATALDRGESAVKVHWLNTLDGPRWRALSGRLNPATTAVVVASKSFTTQETLLQAQAVRDWLGAGWRQRTWAVTSAVDRAVAFGLAPAHILPVAEWVGGRFSLWSAIGISAAAVIGRGAFQRLLDAAWAADDLFRRRPWLDNPAAMLALVWHFLRVDCAFPAFGVISYEPRLGLLPAWLQQVVMESLGKRVTCDGAAPAPASAPLIFGGIGTDLQHSLFQALHQGIDTHPVMLLGSVRGGGEWQRVQLSHLLAQGTALARGRGDADPQRALPGNRPSLTCLIDELDPETLAQVLVMFEHAVFALGYLWSVNAFDQWGVEEGKRLAGAYLRALDGAADAAGLPEALAAFIARHRS